MRFYLLIILIATLLTATAYFGVGKSEFLYLHDEFLTLSRDESINSIFTRNYLDFGVANTTVYLLTFFDRVFYLCVYTIGLSLRNTQILLIFSKYLIVMTLPYLGLSKLKKLYKLKVSQLLVFLIALWYAFNTFTVIYWNGNGFSITLITCYALAPLTLYLAHKSIFSKALNMRHKILFLQTFYIMSFALPLFVVFLFFSIIYIVLAYLYLGKQLFPSTNNKSLILLRNLLILGILYLPFTLFYFIIVREMITTVVGTVNLTGGETYSLLQGGFLNQIRMLFSWGIYTYWEPRNIFTFYKFYDTVVSKVAPFGIYLIILLGAMKSVTNHAGKKYIVIFFALFGTLLFMIKGAQSPFGEIYTYLIDNYAAFRVFRSPDSKFGFGIVLALSSLMLLTIEHITKNKGQKILVSTVLLGVILVQGYPIFSGIAIKGQDTDYSSNRIIHTPKEYKELAQFFNDTDKMATSYILTIPSIEFGHYYLTPEEIHIGQDLLPKLTKKPFVYVSEYSGMLAPTYTNLKEAYSVENITKLQDFPIKYIVIRRDLIPNNDEIEISNRLANCEKTKGCAKKVFENNLFTVYEQMEFMELVPEENVKLKVLNPSKFILHIEGLRGEQDISFKQNYNLDWQLFPLSMADKNNIATFSLDEFKYIETPPLFEETHNANDTLGNTWTINSQKIKNSIDKKFYRENEDGSITISLVLYHKSQSIFYVTIIVALAYSILLAIVFVYVSYDSKNYDHQK